MPAMVSFSSTDTLPATLPDTIPFATHARGVAGSIAQCSVSKYRASSDCYLMNIR